MEAGLPHKYCVRDGENIINISDYVAYDATSGVITAKQSLGNRKAGSLMGTVDKEGYLTFVLRGKRYYCHRVAWFLAHGAWPGTIDHANRDRADNRLINLRECSQAENLRNRPVQRNNSTGYKGVRCKDGRYYGAVKLNGVWYYTKRHNNAADAYAERCNLAEKLHGEYYHP